MFSKKINIDAFTNLISAQTIVVGKINFEGTLKISGAVSGDYIRGPVAKGKLEGTVIVDSGAKVLSTELTAKNVVLAGEVFSKLIEAPGVLRILKTAEVSGAALTYGRLEVEPGAKIHNCTMSMYNESVTSTDDEVKPDEQEAIS